MVILDMFRRVYVKNILFICTGNTCRSPMAEAILSDTLDRMEIRNISVSSAGLYVLEGDRASRDAIKVLSREGIDLSTHRARQINKDMLKSSDLILTMTKGHKDMVLMQYPNISGKVYTLKEYAYGIEDDIVDPFGRGLSAYEEALADIKNALEVAIDKII